MWKRRQKDFKSQRWCLSPRKHCSLETTGLIHILIHRFCGSMHKLDRFKHDWVPALMRGKCTKNPTSIQVAIYNWYLLAKRKSVLPTGVLLSILTTLQLTTLQDRPQCPGVVDQCKTNSKFFFVCLFMLWALVCFGILFYFYWFSVLIFIFVNLIFLRERERGKEEERRGERERDREKRT